MRLAMMTSLSALAALATAALATPLPIHGSDYVINGVTGRQGGGTSRVSTTVYDNTTSSANDGLTSTDNTAIYGDALTLAGMGTLEDFKCTVYNTSADPASLLTSCTVNVSMFRSSDNSLIGSFSGNVSFTGGLAQDFFSFVTFSNLSGLATPLNIDTSNILVTQTLTNVVGATATGVVSFVPVTIGSSPDSFFLADPPGVAAGFYNASVPIDVGYTIGVIPTPGTLAVLGLGGLVASRRRR